MFCTTNDDQIISLVNEQPKPDLFFDSFLELEASNMTSILAFRGKILKHLLQDKFSEFFDYSCPLFYKNKIMLKSVGAYEKHQNQSFKYFYRSAIDNALKVNQIRAV